MTKTEIGRPLYLDIHSLIKVSSPPMPDEVSRYTREKLNLFLTDAPITEKDSDIFISRLESCHAFEWANYHVNLKYGFLITEGNGETAVIFSYRARPDVIVILSKPIRVLYSEREKISDRLFDALMFCFNIVLCKKNGMFFHGAVAEKEGRAVLLTGPFGTKKSLLLLAMLKDSWNFISDDKFILHGGNAYILYPEIMVRAYYLKYLPWLESIIPDVKNFKKAEAFREWIRVFASRHLPAPLFPVLSKFYDPYAPVNINTDVLFHDCKIMKSGKVSAVVLLSDGHNLEITKMSKTEMIEHLAAVQRLISYEESKISSLRERLSLRDSSFRCSIYDIINSNFSDQAFFKLTMPSDCDMDDALRELNHCLSQSA